MLPKHRKPTHPGEILLEEFIKPSGMTRVELAKKMGVPIQRINTLINEKRNMTSETAILLSGVFHTSPEFWMNLQTVYDLYVARQDMADDLSFVKRVTKRLETFNRDDALSSSELLKWNKSRKKK